MNMWRSIRSDQIDEMLLLFVTLQHFEDFVAGHFFNRAHDVLVACKAYLEGAQVCSLVKGRIIDDVDNEGDKRSIRPRFRKPLAEIINTLIHSFTKIGVEDCHKFLYLAEKAADEADQPTHQNQPGP